MIPSFCKQTITRLRASKKDSRGSLVYDWTNPEELIIADCSVQPVSGIVSNDGRVLAVNSTYMVYVNPNTDVHAGDRILYNNSIFSVDEEPQIWESPTGRVSSLQFNMTTYKG